MNWWLYSRRDCWQGQQQKVQADLLQQYEQEGHPQGIEDLRSPDNDRLIITQITDNKKGEEWTKITFKPDLERFGMNGIDDDTNALLMKRVYDMAGTVKDVKVFLNDERIKVKNFKQVSIHMSMTEKGSSSHPS